MNLKSTLLGLAIGIFIFITIPFNSIFRVGTNGSGNVIKEVRKVSTFNAIDAGSAFEIIIEKGDNQSLIIKTDDNIMPKIITRVSDGELKISTKGNINNTSMMKVFITMKELISVDLSGAATLNSESRWETDRMNLELSGASTSELKIKCAKLDLDISGAATSILSGYATKIDGEISGASSLKAYDLEIEHATVDCSGAASAKIFVSKSINGEASGAASIYYKGNPKKIDIRTSGAGSIKKK